MRSFRLSGVSRGSLGSYPSQGSDEGALCMDGDEEGEDGEGEE